MWRYFILLVIFNFVPKEEAFLTTTPENKAVEIHQQTYLNCSCDVDRFMIWWIFGPDGSDDTIVSKTCTVANGYTTKYRTESNMYDGSCNLIILDPTFAEAGLYTCYDISGGAKEAYATLTVLNPIGSPTIILNSSDVADGDLLTFTYTLQFNTSTDTDVSSPIPPILFWTDPNGMNITDASSITNTPNSVTSSFELIANKEDILPYNCTAYFNPPSLGLPDNVASNAPSATFSWATNPIYDILYPPSLPSITAVSAGFSICEAVTLTCASDSNPSPPSFQWIDLTHDVVTDGQATILAEYGSIYTCTATNTIREIQYSNSASYYAFPVPDNSCGFPYPTMISINDEHCAADDLCVYNCPDVLTCDAGTYPPASYEWIIPNGEHLFDQTIRVSENGTYECQATVYIDDDLNFSVKKSIEVINCARPPSTASPSEDTFPTTEFISNNTPEHPCSSITNYYTAVIVLSVFLALSLTLNFAIFAIIACRTQLSTSSSASFSSSSGEKEKDLWETEEPSYTFEKLESIA